MIGLVEIEAKIEKAFKKTVNDYKKDRIHIEEDFRACLYHHMRPFVDNNGLLMLLSHDVRFKPKIIRPDISIFRGKEYLVAVEMKSLASKTSGGDKDIKKLRGYQSGCQRGYFIHIDWMDDRYKKHHRIKSPAAWKDNYFVDMGYVIDTDTIYKFEVKQGEGKKSKL
ncbi:MAG: hypothetical protein KAR25_00965 [Methanosarcinales archaeon]|nr:hypothetical protein [Methanosarcinales archaeon]